MDCYSYNFIVIFIILHINVIYGQINTVLHNQGEYDLVKLNDICTDKKSGERGVCKYLSDCSKSYKTWKYVDQIDAPTICGFDDKKVIICCTENEKETNVKLGDDEYIPFNDSCILPTSGEMGVIKKKQHCPISNLPKMCEYEICEDLVCCPQTPLKRLRQKCNYEKFETVIRLRLKGNYICKVPNSDETGRYTYKESCKYYSDINKSPKVCDWNICEEFVCCPEKNLIGADCAMSSDYIFDYVDFDAGSCTMKDTGLSGYCTSEQNCPSQSDENPNRTLCGHECCSEVVCCPHKDLKLLNPNEQACNKYKKSVFENYKKINFIKPEIDKKRRCSSVKPSGGILAHPKEFPHMAVLGYGDENEIHWECGGSLISDKFVLTAAHCLNSLDYGFVKYVRLGIIGLNITRKTDDCPVEYLISKRIPHPDYRSNRQYNDIALLELDSKVEFTPDIRPICLPTSSEIPKRLVAIGFGLTKFSGDRTENLIKVYLDFYDNKECNDSFKFNFNSKFNGIDENTQFCAGSRDSIQDTCPGDSGGPIEGRHKEYYKMSVIYGITSFGRACGFKNSPAIYTYVYNFVPWIEGIVWPNN